MFLHDVSPFQITLLSHYTLEYRTDANGNMSVKAELS